MQGHVTCTCFFKGRTRPHPRPHLLKRTPGLVELDERADAKAVEEHEEWLERACTHPFLQLVAEPVGEPADFELAEFALTRLGVPAPRLMELVQSRCPLQPWPAVDAAAALEEVVNLRASRATFPVELVVAEDSGVVILEVAPSRVYCYCGDGTQLGVGPEGLWMKRHDETLFCTESLSQEENPDGSFRLEPGGGAARTSSAAYVPYDAENPDRLLPVPRRVRHRTEHRGVEALDFLLGSVERLCKASQTTGHPVVWSD